MVSVGFIVRASLVGFGLALSSGCAGTTPDLTLSSSDNLDSWRSASGSEKNLLCEKMANELAEPNSNPLALCSCISTTADDGGYDFMKVSEIAEVCIGILKTKELQSN